jgi:hypothetical protein
MTRYATSALLASVLAVSSAGCYGSYGAFNQLHRWNARATASKVANSFIHFGLWVIPVYQLSLLGDWLIFNNIEFVTGSNPFGGGQP